jgi:hypothetical protein
MEEHGESKMNNKLTLLALVLLLGLVLPSVNAQSLPTWIQDMAGWYGDDKITDAEFIETLQFLIDEGIIIVPQVAQVVQQVSATEPNLDAVWDAINFNAEEIRSTVKFNPTADLYSRFNEIENHLVEVENANHDNTVKLQSERTVAEHTHIDYEMKYKELMAMYIQLGERVVELEKKEIERHDREIRSGEVN